MTDSNTPRKNEQRSLAYCLVSTAITVLCAFTVAYCGGTKFWYWVAFAVLMLGTYVEHVYFECRKARPGPGAPGTT